MSGEDEGARQALIQATRHGINQTREAANLNRRMAHAYAQRAAGVTGLPVEMLQDYAAAMREDAASALLLAEALDGEIAKRSDQA